MRWVLGDFMLYIDLFNGKIRVFSAKKAVEYWLLFKSSAIFP